MYPETKGVDNVMLLLEQARIVPEGVITGDGALKNETKILSEYVSDPLVAVTPY